LDRQGQGRTSVGKTGPGKDDSRTDRQREGSATNKTKKGQAKDKMTYGEDQLRADRTKGGSAQDRQNLEKVSPRKTGLSEGYPDKRRTNTGQTSARGAV
jgi:hypothetical protein